MKATDQIKRAALEKTVDYFLDDPEEHIAKIMDLLDKVAPADLFPSQRAAFRNAIDEQNNWYRLIMHMLDTMNPQIRDRLVKTFLIDSNLMAWPVQEQARREHACNIPWAILLDPTSACNLHCTGCWAAEYGHRQNLSYDEIDSIINQGVELGTHVYIYTGGEPLMRKHDLIRLCEAHPDCAFLCFTNSTLIDEAFCQDMLRVANFVPAISVEGFEQATDARRGSGTYAKVARAMELLRDHGLRFVLLHFGKRRFHRIRGVLRLAHRTGRPVRVDIHVHARGRRRAHRFDGASRPTRAPVPFRAPDAPGKTAVHA